HTIVAQAVDAAYNKAYATTTVTTKNGIADTIAPTSVITGPANGATVSGSLTVVASGSDNAAVSKMELYKDGILVSSGPSNPLSYTWDTTKETNGRHSLQSKAYDSSGNV